MAEVNVFSGSLGPFTGPDGGGHYTGALLPGWTAAPGVTVTVEVNDYGGTIYGYVQLDGLPDSGYIDPAYFFRLGFEGSPAVGSTGVEHGGGSPIAYLEFEMVGGTQTAPVWGWTSLGVNAVVVPAGDGEVVFKCGADPAGELTNNRPFPLAPGYTLSPILNGWKAGWPAHPDLGFTSPLHGALEPSQNIALQTRIPPGVTAPELVKITFDLAVGGSAPSINIGPGFNDDGDRDGSVMIFAMFTVLGTPPPVEWGAAQLRMAFIGGPPPDNTFWTAFRGTEELNTSPLPSGGP